MSKFVFFFKMITIKHFFFFNIQIIVPNFCYKPSFAEQFIILMFAIIVSYNIIHGFETF